MFAILLLFPLGKGYGSSFEQTWIPLTQGCSMPSLVESGQVVLEKKMKLCKGNDTDDNEDWQRKISIRKSHNSPRPIWANNNQNIAFFTFDSIMYTSREKNLNSFSINERDREGERERGGEIF